MIPTGSPASKTSREEGRHLELLEEMLSQQNDPALGLASSTNSSKLSLSVTRTKSRSSNKAASELKSRRGSRLNIFSIREHLRGLRKSAAAATLPTSTTAPSVNRPPMNQRAVSEPLKTPTKTTSRRLSNKFADEAEEEVEDWDRDSSDDTSRRTPRARQSAGRLTLNGEHLPKLVECLDHVRERCGACLGELDALVSK